VVEEGTATVYTQEHGRVAEVGPGDNFGELAVLNSAPRKATVKTIPGTEPLVCLRLHQGDVKRLLSSERCAEALASVAAEYGKAEQLKVSEVVAKPLRKYWELMVTESARLAGSAGEGQVTREGYVQMHLRVSKALKAGFDLKTAENIANMDWAEDITAFSGDAGVDIWLEEVKKKFKDASTRFIAEHDGGWTGLFEKYDEDGSGSMEMDEFMAAVRGDCNINSAVVNDDELAKLFAAVDTDSSGDIDIQGACALSTRPLAQLGN